MKFFLWRPGKDPGIDHEPIWGAIALVLLGAARFVPSGLVELYFCPFRGITGIPCLTCGMTRAFRHMVRLEVADAFSVSPMGAVVSLLAIALLAYSIVVVLFRLPRIRLCITSRLMRVALWFALPALIVANWLYLLLHGV